MGRRKIELLAPARDLTTGMEAIRHGADAVYIGAERFGARVAAANSLADIRRLVDFAHPYGVKIYVTLNTLLYDDELEDVKYLVDQLTETGVDALIVQDIAVMALQEEEHKIALHASTQMDNQTAEKVAWLAGLGFEQVVLARELTLEEIREIHEKVPYVKLEAFVHGAICVSYNGRCQASQYCFGRSANRGECAQFCRMPFDLLDSAGRELQHQRHLLSLRDMNRTAYLEAMLDVGVSSLKMEGRLKDVGYVKNVTAWYRQHLDEIFQRRDEYERSSWGHESIGFEPNPAKSFNRGFTEYFLHGRTTDMVNRYTPKSMGEELNAKTKLNNGDGLCFLDSDGRLQGFRINRSDDLGKISLPTGTRLFRNHDQHFEQLLAHSSATRKIGVKWRLRETPEGFALQITTEDGRQVEQTFDLRHELARSDQRQPVERQLSRLGDTPYESQGVDLQLTANWFVPASTMAGWRRSTLQALENLEQPLDITPVPKETSMPGEEVIVANHLARSLYRSFGANDIRPAMEVDSRGGADAPLLMTCRYCLRYELWMCRKTTGDGGPLWLRLSDGRRFRVEFDCRKCQMALYADS